MLIFKKHFLLLVFSTTTDKDRPWPVIRINLVHYPGSELPDMKSRESGQKFSAEFAICSIFDIGEFAQYMGKQSAIWARFNATPVDSRTYSPSSK